MSFVYVLIPLLPLLASIIIALAGRRLGEESRRVGVLAIGVSFGLSVVALVHLVLRGTPIEIPLYEFLRCGDLVVENGLYFDQLAVLLLLLVTGVSFVVHVYSSGYMIGDERYSQFFAVMTLFTFGMISLVLSNNLLMMFICWEVMGICSYLLISHQADRRSACQAATKAFLVNAVADVGLLFGIVLTYSTFETLDIRQILGQAAAMSDESINLLSWLGLEWHVRTVTLITLFLLMGCLGKSAQVPFHVWLPNAMEAPTPVSALIHAATMVNAGPYLLVRFGELVKLSPAAMTVITLIGAITAIFAAVVSLTQSDIKKILAYSTISQIGFMIMTCGLGAFVAAIFHMLAHGFLKGFLFLSTGNQLDEVGSHGHHEGAAGRSKASMPAVLVALVLACIPAVLIFSGPYESLWTVHNSTAARIAFWGIGLLTVFFTAMYLVRGISSLFQPAPDAVVRPSPISPMHLLGIGVGTVGLIGCLLAVWNWVGPFLSTSIGTPYAPSDGVRLIDSISPVAAIVAALVAAVSGWGLGLLLTARPRSSLFSRSDLARGLYVLFLNKLYFDEIYMVYVVQPTIGFVRWLWRVIDTNGIDGVIYRLAGSILLGARWLLRVIDVRATDRAAVGRGNQDLGFARWLWESVDVRRVENSTVRLGDTTDAGSKTLDDVQPRALQHHLVVLIAWLVVAILFFYRLVL